MLPWAVVPTTVCPGGSGCAVLVGSTLMVLPELSPVPLVPTPTKVGRSSWDCQVDVEVPVAPPLHVPRAAHWGRAPASSR